MTNQEIAMKILLTAIDKQGFRKPKAKKEDYNTKLAETVAEMYKIVYQVVDNTADKNNLEALSSEELQAGINRLLNKQKLNNTVVE